MSVTESAMIGLIGTVTGVLLGWLLLAWLVRTLIPQAYPDLGIVTYVAPTTLVTAVVLGVIVVAVAPVFTVPKLRRMDIPSTLRVIE